MCPRTRPPTAASRIAVTFDLGTNLDIAQVQVQNRVAIATPRLPADVRNIGVTVTKSSPDLMMVVHLVFARPLARHAVHLQFRDARDQGPADPHQRRRLDHGVRQPRLFDADLARPAAAAVARPHRRRRHAGAGRGRTCRSPRACSTSRRSTSPGAFQIAVKTQGRLADVEEFGNIIVKQTATAVVRLRDVAKIELAAVDYSSNSYLDLDPAVALAVFQRPGSNALVDRAGNPRRHGAAGAAASGRRQIHHRLRPDAVHPGVGRTPCRRRSSRRSCWSCSWSSSSCRPGAPRSFRWSPFRSR